LTDEQGREQNVYDADGYRVPRRRPFHSKRVPPCGILLDLTTVRSLFQTSTQIAHELEENPVDEDSKEEATIHVFPQAFTKNYGHMQANDVPQGFKSLINMLNRTLALNSDDDRPAIWPIALQGYNNVQHNLTDRAGALEVVRGRVTAALAGTRVKGARTKRIFNRIVDSVETRFPHEHVKGKLSKSDVSRAFRFEIVVTINLDAMPLEQRTGR
jgi:hypothetical protein